MRGFQQIDSTNLNDKNLLDQFISGCINSLKLFTISRNDRKSIDPAMLQQFHQGTLINTLTVYLRELELPDGPLHPSSRQAIDDTDDDSDDAHPTKAKFKALQKSKGTASLYRCSTSQMHS